jgi:hypothetical protein
LLEKETLKLPFKHKEIKISNFSILRVTSDGEKIVENMFSNAKLVKNQSSALGINYLHISGLEEGKYQVWLKKEDVTFSVIVHDGKHWNVSNDFILKKRSLLYRGRQKLDSLRIDHASLHEEKIDNELYNFLDIIPGGSFTPGKTRFHVWAYNFLPYDL